MNYQKLFNYMKEEHGITLLQSDMQEICNIVREIQKYNNMNRQLKFKALYENKLHDVYGILFPDLIVKIPLQRLPFTQEVKPDEIIQFIDKVDVNGCEIFEGDYDNDGNCVVWCNKCNSWQFAQLDVPTKEICIPCHSCDGNFMFNDHIYEFEKVGNRFL